MENEKGSQVGSEVSTTRTENDFKKNAPVPYFRWFSVLSPWDNQQAAQNTIGQAA